jgi:hypothetical protein
MAEVAAEVLALQELKARLLARVAGVDARIEDLETNGFPLTGTGDIDEPRRMKIEAARKVETAQRAPAPEKRKKSKKGS